MAQPKRKQSKQRSRKRRGANRFTAPELAKAQDGSLYMRHHIDPTTGLYRGRQVMTVDES